MKFRRSVFCPFLRRKSARKDGDLLRSSYVAGGGYPAGHPRPRDRRLRPEADPDHLVIRTESSETNSIRHVQFLPGYYRNLCPAGHDYPRLAGRDYSGPGVTTISTRRVTTISTGGSRRPMRNRRQPFFSAGSAAGPCAFDHTCRTPHEAAIAINLGGRVMGR
jgi:hypothetical protein